jgi:hypothetical protein
MNLLPLDDPRWRDLCHRNWSNGKPSAWAPDAPFVPDILAKLVEHPERTELFSDLWPWLCSEGTAWAASYAAVPYAVDFARRVSPANRFEYLLFVGLVAQCSCSESGLSFEINPYLVADYEEALKLAVPLLAETLPLKHDQTETRYILSSIAALKGHSKLADVLGNIACICGQCEQCGVSVYPEVLQEVI